MDTNQRSSQTRHCNIRTGFQTVPTKFWMSDPIPSPQEDTNVGKLCAQFTLDEMLRFLNSKTTHQEQYTEYRKQYADCGRKPPVVRLRPNPPPSGNTRDDADRYHYMVFFMPTETATELEALLLPAGLTRSGRPAVGVSSRVIRTCTNVTRLHIHRPQTSKTY